MNSEFNRSDLEAYLPDKLFKGLSKEYILYCIFNEKIQKGWIPQVGDIIVGPTGNIFVLGGKHHLVPGMGGDTFFFAPGFCSRDGDGFMESTFSSTVNKSGIKYGLGGKPVDDLYHTAFSHFRYVPYPHEL
jgi:hypothetical protein